MLFTLVLAATLYATCVPSVPLRSTDLESPLDPVHHVVKAEPDISAFCVTLNQTATTEEFTKATKQYCHEMTSHDVHIATGGGYTRSFDCNDERCLTLSLYFKCYDQNNATTSGVMPRRACMEYFQLPWTSGEMCMSGGYVGSTVPGACWTALSLATPPQSSS